MLGDNRRLRKHLRENGKAADAEVLESKERPWANKHSGEFLANQVYRLKLQVRPAGEPPFEAEVTEEWTPLHPPRVGLKVPVLYDPRHHSKVVLDERPGRYEDPLEALKIGPSMTSGDPELDQLAALEDAEKSSGGAPAEASQSRLDRLQQLADLHDRGVLNDSEFAAEKSKILGEG